tara:strand:- start:908 stop:1492 length:585 start_codon:yes stop_codon:yes gene_type:complete
MFSQIKKDYINKSIKNEILSNNNTMQFPLEFNKALETFKNKFASLKGLKEGDKLGKDNNGNYVIFKAGFFQKSWRYYYNEDRSKTDEYLNQDFQSYSAFLDRIIETADGDLLNVFKDFSNKVSAYSQKIINRLYNLKKTYKNDINNKKIIARIDSIILVLLDFKDRINKIYQTKNLAHMSMYLQNNRSPVSRSL